jgi:hypothetical protein
MRTNKERSSNVSKNGLEQLKHDFKVVEQRRIGRCRLRQPEHEQKRGDDIQDDDGGNKWLVVIAQAGFDRSGLAPVADQVDKLGNRQADPL